MRFNRMNRFVVSTLLVLAACSSGVFDGSAGPDGDDGLGPVSGSWNSTLVVTTEFTISAFGGDELQMYADVHVTNTTDAVRTIAIGGCPFQFLAYADPDRSERIWRQESFISPLSKGRRGCTADIRGFELEPQQSTFLRGGVFVGLVTEIVGDRPDQMYYFTLIIDLIEPEPGRIGEFVAGEARLPGS